MALVKAISFDWAKAGEGGITVSGAAFSTTQKRTGTHALRLWSNSVPFYQNGQIPFPELSEFYVQFGFYLDTNVQGTVEFLRWRKGTTTLGGLKLNGARKLEIWTGNFASLVATAADPLPLNNWCVVELHVKIADAGGITLRQDFIEQAVFTGDTKPGTDTGADVIWIGNAWNSGGYVYIDDFIIHDTTGAVNNSWPRGAKCYLIKPNSDGAVLQWTPTPIGAHYAAVDEVPPSAADYLQTILADKVDELGLEDLPAEALSVKGVVLQAWAFKGSAISPTQVELGLKLGGMDYLGGDLALGTSEGWVGKVWNQHPGGGSFSINDINNAQLLLKSRV
ncbi:MAG: hypothetical protein FJ135_01835 [Deltaproteobacteria bacterium]|nr:hypothetical protein [Deltaproteobacteria bacterium]